MSYQYPLKFGKYIFTRRIAVGGMAEVFKAKLIGPKGFEKNLAVKRILPEFSEDEDFVQMFVDEARISSNLHHSNIVQVYDFGEVGSAYYIAMEWVDGPNLKNLIQRYLKDHDRFPRDLAVYICLQIAKALDYAHNVKLDGESSLHLVHRDVSPQNILVSRVGEIKITDFGIAKAAIKLSKTQPGKVQGKLSYMSPEQATGKSIDRRSDIFSLGIILFELLTGMKVYGGENTGERYDRIREAKVPNLDEACPGLPAELTRLAYQMVAKNPEDRPQNGYLVIEALTTLLSHASYSKLEQDLAEIVDNFYPKEKSDSGIDKKILNLSEPPNNQPELTQEFLTEVSLDRLPISQIPDAKTQHTKPIDVVPPEVTSRRKAPAHMSYMILSILSVLVLGALTHLIIKRNNPPKLPENSVKNTPPTASPTPQDAPIARGPVDVDLRDAAAEREKEIQSRLNELQEEVWAAKADAEKTAAELNKAQAKLAKLNQDEVAGPCPRGMIHIAKGSFLIGSSEDDHERNDLVESKLQSVTISSFCIDKYEYPNKHAVVPRIRVTWNEAFDLCAKGGKRLCFQEEWERACKGPESENEERRFPYGNKWRSDACNTQAVVDDLPKDRKILPSGELKSCQTKDSVFDLSGNVDEWTFSPGSFNSDSQVTKGGSSYRPGYQSRCASIREVIRTTRENDLGFRCCKDAD